MSWELQPRPGVPGAPAMITLSKTDLHELANLLLYVKSSTNAKYEAVARGAEWVGPQLDKWTAFLLEVNAAWFVKEMAENNGRPGVRL